MVVSRAVTWVIEAEADAEADAQCEAFISFLAFLSSLVTLEAADFRMWGFGTSTFRLVFSHAWEHVFCQVQEPGGRREHKP